MYKFKIENICFKNGCELKPNRLTVIIGPNNSGKSRILKDIKELITKRDPQTIIVKGLEFNTPSSVDSLLETYKINVYKDMHDNIYTRGLNPTMDTEYRVNMWKGWEEYVDSQLLQQNEEFIKVFREWFGVNFINMLGTEQRLKLITEQPSADEFSGNNNLLNEFYNQGPEIEEKLREIIKVAFGIDIKLDFSTLIKLKFRIGENLDSIPVDPREARELFEMFETLDDQGDGIKSFVATILSMIVGEKEVLLLDEPEAFLHPPQATKLGEYIAQMVSEKKQVFIATHSADILKGIISKTQELNIIRIDRTSAGSNISILDNEEVRKIAHDPLLCSSRVLEGVFYKGAVVVEADSDAVFYHRIARQIRNSDDIHYTHAHNKQTVGKVMVPYKRLGVNAATIVDFDILRDWHEFKNLLDKMEFEQAEIDSLQNLREKIVAEIQQIDCRQQLMKLKVDVESILQDITGKIQCSEEINSIQDVLRQLKRIREDNAAWADYKAKGRDALKTTINDFDNVYESCKKRGLFIVPVGELESWLVQYGVEKSSNKGKWIVSALQKVPELEINIDNQPWKFIQEIHDYLRI